MKLLTKVAIVSAFAATSGAALAAGPNDGPQYPNMESHKQYPAYRNQDHNNPSPRYAATTKQTAPRTVAIRNPGYKAHAMSGRVLTGNHG